jgi:hypothetical protein
VEQVPFYMEIKKFPFNQNERRQRRSKRLKFLTQIQVVHLLTFQMG